MDRWGCCLVLMGQARRVVPGEGDARASGPNHRGRHDPRTRRVMAGSLEVRLALLGDWSCHCGRKGQKVAAWLRWVP